MKLIETRRQILSFFASIMVLLPLCTSSLAQSAKAGWHAASEAELHTIIPARAPAISERIETEFRTASGITNGKGQYVAGVVMITAGYSAEGKYSHYFLTQVPIKVGNLALAPGDYLFGWTRTQDALRVSFYQASTGTPIGDVDALRDASTTRVESFRIWPPAAATPDKAVIQIGRFTFPYSFSPR